MYDVVACVLTWATMIITLVVFRFAVKEGRQGGGGALEELAA